MKRYYRDIFINEEIFTEIYFFNVGHERCHPKHSYGPNIREHYVIHYIVKGKGIFKTRNKVYHLKANNFFLIRQNELSYYEANEEDPWEYYWLGFDGEKVEDLLLSRFVDAQTDIGIVNTAMDVLREQFEQLIETPPFDYSKTLSRYAQFIQLISEVDGGVSITKSRERETMKRKYSEAFMLYVQNNFYLKELRIANIARSMNLNPSYLSQVIKDDLGITPIGYLKEFRLQKASILLELGNATVSEVADLVGYESLQSFSRAFKEQFKQSPSNYKGQH